MKTLFFTLAFTLTSFNAFAQVEDEALMYEITEGKIRAAEENMIRDLLRDVDAKQQKAAQLIGLLGESLNARYSDDIAKEEAQYVHSGFVARLQDIREDQETFDRKQLIPDLATLQKQDRKLDKLIADLKIALK